MLREVSKWVTIFGVCWFLLPGCDEEEENGCKDECTAGTGVCENNAYRKCGNFDADECLELSADLETCARQEQCQTSGCVEICKDECQEKTLQCAGNGYQECKNVDPDPCFEWSETVACGRKELCDQGKCEVVCADDCLLGLKQCAIGANAYEVCDNFDVDPCWEWGKFGDCSIEQICDDGECGPEGCVDKCNLQGAILCTQENNGFQVCGDFDQDACLEWGDLHVCDEGQQCGENGCSCEDECEQDARRCLTGEIAGVEICGDFDDDTCLDWIKEPLLCDDGFLCEEGVCSCEDECEAKSAQCAQDGPAARIVCGQNDGDACLEWSEPVLCGENRICESETNACFVKGPYGNELNNTIYNIVLEAGDCDLDGDPFNLGDYLDEKLTLVTFHTGWCGYCKDQMEQGEAYYQHFKDRGLRIIQVLSQDHEGSSESDDLHRYSCAERNLFKTTFEMGIDVGGVWTEKMGIGSLPTQVFVNGNMKIVYILEGYAKEEMYKITESLLK